MRRQHDFCFHEKQMRQLGFRRIAGIDEAGRGPLAGPVVAAACVFPEGLYIDGIDDSKKLTPEKRQELFETLTHHPEIEFGIGVVEATLIDQINILQATLRAMVAAASYLKQKPCCALVDGNQLPKCDFPVYGIVKGDSASQTIAAASIIAKVTRDRIMQEIHKAWPHFGFDHHVGYGTPEHLAALKRFGPIPFIHRMTFEPVKALRGGEAPCEA